jgi:transcriptional regulator with XRE-family HTH domain
MVYSMIDVDISIISKIEQGDRFIKKEQIPKLTEILKAIKKSLMAKRKNIISSEQSLFNELSLLIE